VPEEEKKRDISLLMALIPVGFLIAALSVYILMLRQPTSKDLPIIPIIFGIVVAAIVAALHGHSWKFVERSMIHGITLALNAMLILMAIGGLIGTWMLGGVVPSMIYYGLQLLSPGIFLVATLLICSIVSLGTGSSWSTAGTVGVALIAIGGGLGIPIPMVAGAVVSGAYFGDKMSPLSDTTNLAPAVAGTDLFTHVGHMVYTTTPGYIISLILYGLLGLQFASDHLDTSRLQSIFKVIEGNFTINPILLLAPVVVIALVVMRIPPLPAIFCGAALGGVFAMVFQGRTLADVINAAYYYPSYFSISSGSEQLDKLLNNGGIIGMMETIALITCALSFGGIMERTGMLRTIASALLKRAKSTGSLVATTIFSCIAMNILAGDQYMAIVIPGRMYKSAYEERGLHPKNLSRALEDSGTLTSPLIPWNTCGAFMTATLGVSPLLYLPWAFVNLSNPITSIIYGYTGFTMDKADPKSLSEAQSQEGDDERTDI
jgi:NhaC family Na+:H+ antiporter